MFDSKIKTKELTMTALMAALIFVVTWIIRVPLPFSSGGGYLNVGDVMIVICAYLLGGPQAAIAAAIGSALADLAAGAVIYIPATFVIKGAMGLVAGRILKTRNFKTYLTASITAGAMMITGYAIFEWIFFNAAYAIAALPFNGIQWAGCVIAAALIYPVTRQLSIAYQRR